MKKNTSLKLGVSILLFSVNGFTQCLNNINAGLYHGLALKPNGSIFSWGNGAYGTQACGLDNNDTDALEVTQVGTDTNWLKIYAGTFNSFAIKNDNTLWACGTNNEGELGNGSFGLGTVSRTFSQIGTLNNWKTISTNSDYTLALKTNGTIWSCGINTEGQLGDGTTISRRSFVQIGNATNWKEIGSIIKTGYGIKTDGSLWSWGLNGGGGYLGIDDLSVIQRASPGIVGTDSDWKNIFGGPTTVHVLLLKTNGKLFVVGGSWSSGQGANGLGFGVSCNLPTQIGSDSNWSTATCGYNNSFAIKTNGTLWAWGQNDLGQLGDGTTIDRGFPIQIGTATNWASVSAGYGHTIATKTDGSLWSWGDGSLGQQPVGSYTSSLVPVQINVSGCVLKTKRFSLVNDKINIAPNPAKNSTNITFSNTTTPPLLEIYSVLGKLITSYQATSNKDAWQLDTSNLASGLYIVVLKEDNQITMQKKLVIE